MELDEIRVFSNKIQEFYMELWHSFFSSKSPDWVNKNLLHISFDKPVYDHIKANASCIRITEELRVYEVYSQWIILVLKDNQ